jgi:hypothetical protein
LRDLPRLYNGDLLPPAAVAELGFSVNIHRGPMFYAYRALRDAYGALREHGRLDPSQFGDTAELRMAIAGTLGLDEVYELERRYAPGDA